MNLFYIIVNIMVYITVMVLMMIMPFITRKNLVFGVTIPSNQYKHKAIKEFRRLYIGLNLGAGVMILAALVVLYLIFDVRVANSVNGIVMVVYIMLVFFVYNQVRHKVLALKQEEEWDKAAKDIRVADTDFATERLVCSPLWFLVYLVVIVTTILSVLTKYNFAPDMLPIQMNLDNEIVRYVEKTPTAVAFPIIMQFMMLITFLLVYVSIGQVSPYIDPENIELSKKQARTHKKVWSYFTVFTGFLMTVVFALIELSMLELVSMQVSAMASILISVAVLVLAIILAVKVGQSGSRIKGKTKTGSVIMRDDDRYWKAGIFYFNKEDSSLFVEKRFGVGYTINFARPLAIFLFVGLLAIIFGVSFFASV